MFQGKCESVYEKECESVWKARTRETEKKDYNLLAEARAVFESAEHSKR